MIIALLGSSATMYCGNFDSFKFLPAKSLIKQECADIGFGWGPFRSKKQDSCKYIYDTLAKFDAPDPKPGLTDASFGLLLGPNGKDWIAAAAQEANSREMKNHVFTILGEKYSKDAMREEHTLLADTAQKIRATRLERRKQAETPKRQQRQDPY